MHRRAARPLESATASVMKRPPAAGDLELEESADRCVHVRSHSPRNVRTASTGLNIRTSTIESHGTNGSLNCRYSTGARLDEMQPHPLGIEMIARVELASACRVHVIGGAFGAANREHALLSLEVRVAVPRRALHPLGGDLEEPGDRPEARHGQLRHSIRGLRQHPFDEREHEAELRSTVIGVVDRLERLLDPPRVLPGVVDERVVNRRERARMSDRHREVRRLPVDEDAIAVDPPLLDERHIVVHDEAIDRVHELEVADVRKQVRLHDPELHASVPCFAHDVDARAEIRVVHAEPVAPLQIRVGDHVARRPACRTDSWPAA